MLKYGAGILALVSFGIFFVNISLGSLADNRFLSDLREVVTLGITCILFVIMALMSEHQTKCG